MERITGLAVNMITLTCIILFTFNWNQMYSLVLLLLICVIILNMFCPWCTQLKIPINFINWNAQLRPLIAWLTEWKCAARIMSDWWSWYVWMCRSKRAQFKTYSSSVSRTLNITQLYSRLETEYNILLLCPNYYNNSRWSTHRSCRGQRDKLARKDGFCILVFELIEHLYQTVCKT